MKHYTVLLLTVVLLALVLATAGGAAAEPAAPEAYSFSIPGEPNDTFAAANNAFDGYLMFPADVDFLRYELEERAGLQAEVEIYSESDTPPLLRVELAVFDSAQTLLAEDANCDDVARTPVIDAPVGLYYLRIRACNGYFDSDQLYEVNVHAFGAFEREPNDSFATATPVNLGDHSYGQLPTPADLDYFRIELPSATLLTYSVGNSGYQASHKFELALYDATHALLAEDADCNSSTVLETIVGPGTYFLSVQPCAGTPANSDLYVLVVNGEPFEAEPNDTFAAATPLTLESTYGQYVQGILPVPTDRDYYRFDAPIPLRFSTSVYFVNVGLVLYDAAHTELARGTAAGLWLYLTPGTYYLLVEPVAGTDADETYQLNFGWQPFEVEPNNSRATATAVVPSIDGGFVAAAIQPAADVDFYRFEGQAGSLLRLHVGADDNSLKPELALLAADGTVLASDSSDPACAYYCSADLEYALPADAAYYLRVRSATHPVGVGDYAVRITEFTYSTTDFEPNDTPAQAVPVAYGDNVHGDIEGSDLIDYYRFTGQAGDEMVLAIPEYYGGTGAEVTLTDPSMNPVLLTGPDYPGAYWATLPATGDYTLSFTNTGGYGGDNYSFILMLTGGDEPNNTMATATGVPFGPVLAMAVDYPCDIDWFRFQGRAGDVVAELAEDVADPSTFLYDADGDPVGPVLPADGTYYVKIYSFYAGREGSLCYFEADEDFPAVDNYPFGQALWVSAAVDGLGGPAAKRGDILTRKTAAGQWQIVFDASDVGLTANLAAFERMPNGSILLSLGTTQNVPGLGKVTPQDIIRFSPTALGDTTAGTFQWFLDGSDVGLSTTGEKIDAISMQRDVAQPLRISISGAGSVPRQSGGALKVADEDVINFVATRYGADSAGAWRVYLDGSTVPGMAAEDVTAMTRVEVYPQSDSPTLLSFDSAYTINGQTGTPFTVALEGTWRPAVQRLMDKKIDGLSVGPAWTP